MFGRRVKVGLLVSAVGLVFGSVGFASAANTVKSDSVTLSGTLTPTPTGYTFKTTKCSLTSDLETKAFTCSSSGTINSNFAGTAKLTSKDGTDNWSFQLTPVAGGFKMTGRGNEADNADPGQPKPHPYGATFNGSLTLTSSTTFTGSITVSEASTAP